MLRIDSIAVRDDSSVSNERPLTLLSPTALLSDDSHTHLTPLPLLVQATQAITIPKEHHRFILGRGGQRLRDLETQTATKIQVPGQADPSDKITVAGIKEGIEKAIHELQMISDEQVRQVATVTWYRRRLYDLYSLTNGQHHCSHVLICS